MRIPALILSVFLLSACHEKSYSEAVLISSTPPSSSAAPSSSAPAATPATPTTGLRSSLRPRELKLNDFKPCELLVPAQLRTLGMNERTKPQSVTDEKFDEPKCVFTGRGRTWSITTVTKAGIEHWINSKTRGDVEVFATEPIAMAYPALVFANRAHQASQCSVVVDTADAQMLIVGIDLTDGVYRGGPCREARPIAEAAMLNLIT